MRKMAIGEALIQGDKIIETGDIFEKRHFSDERS